MSAVQVGAGGRSRRAHRSRHLAAAHGPARAGGARLPRRARAGPGGRRPRDPPFRTAETRCATPATRSEAWAYPLMAAMAFLETTIPPLTIVFPGEWAVLFGGAMAGEGSVAIVPLMLIVWACSAAGDSVCFALGRRLGRPFLARYGRGIGLTEARLDKVDGWLDHYGPPAVCFGRLLPLARPFGPFVAGASHFPYRRFLPWSVLGTLLVHAGLLRARLRLLQLVRRGGREARARGARPAGADRRRGGGRAGGSPAAGPGGRAVMRVLTVAAIVAAAALLALVMFGGASDYRVNARFENASQVVRGGLVEIAGKKVGTVTDLRPDRRRAGRARAGDRRRVGAAAAGHPRADPPVRPVRAGQPLRGPGPAHLARARGPSRRRGARDGGHHRAGGAGPDLRDLRPPDPRLPARRVPRLGAPVRG